MDRAIEVIQTNQELLRQFLEIASKKYEVGKGLQQDVLLAQLELSKLLDQEIQLKSMRRQESIKLNTLMDISPDNDVRLPSYSPGKILYASNEQALYQSAESSRPILHEKKSLISAAQSKLDLAKKGYLPDFKLGVVYGFRDGKNPPPRGGERSDFLSVMLSASMPLYARTKQSKEVCQRAEELIKRRCDFQDKLTSVRSEISLALTELNQAREQYSLFKTGIIPQAQQTVSSMLAAYQASEVDFLNLVRSQITLFNYELQYWKVFADSKKALARLTAATGEENIYAE